jgi:hypothetical protein
MRLFPTDWSTFLDQIVLWGELSISARKTFLDGFRPRLSFEASPRDLATEELKVAGLLEKSENADYLAVAEGHVGFYHVMKALEKYPLFEGSGLAALCAYLGDHYTSRERSLLHESLAFLPNELTRVAGLISSVEWLETALPRDGSPGAGLAEAWTMLRFFRDQRDRVALRDLEDYFPKISREDLCAGIRVGLQRAVFFLGLRRSDLEPLLGIWPAAARRLRRIAVVLAPEPVKAVQTFRHPYLVEDMTTLLLASRVEPIPLRRGDEKPFIRFVEEVSPALLSIPDWVENFMGLHQEGRIALALRALRLTGLVIPDGSPASSVRRQGRRGRRDLSAASGHRHSRAPGIAAWKEPALVPAPWSAAWTGGDLAERREKVVGMLAIGPGGPSGLLDLLEEEWTSSEGAREKIVPWLIQAFSSVPIASFIRFADFAEYQAAMGSPLAAVQADGAAAGPARVGPAATEEALEELWKSFLGIFMGRCLLSLDGVEAGITGDRAPCFRLTHVGRRILGLPGESQEEREVPQAQETAIIVQPNFEIVFLVPSPAAEAALGRFCERVGREVGVLFRITKQSVRRGARSGLSHDQVMNPLINYSRSELPENVRQEIQGWLAATDLDSALPAT